MRSRFHKRIQRSSWKVEPILLLKIGIIIILYSIFFLMLNYIITRVMMKEEFEKELASFASKNQETIFEIGEITLYSSAAAKENTQSPQNWSLDITQFTDISFSISNPKNKLIQSLEITDITFNPTPEIRYPCVCL